MRRNRRRKRKQNTIKSRTDWVWEFSKRVVVMLTAAYFIVVFYAGAIMAQTSNLDSLSQLLTETADVLKTCVFGYFVKAGIENAFKIKLNRHDLEENDTPLEETEG